MREGSSRIVGTSAAMEQVRAWIEKVAKSPVPALIRGESGTGKELVAQELHRLSRRSAGRFVVVDLGGVAEGVAESELFGHEKGAYTDAVRSRTGAFRQADGGVLFLDELGNAPLGSQAKLLRALERGEVTPVGSDSLLPVDVRVVAATNADLPGMVRDGQFRGDLLHRLEVLPCILPPLRERLEDLDDLVPHLLARVLAAYAQESGAGPGTLEVSPEAREVMRMHSWPGNVRELYSCLWRGVTYLQGGDGVIGVEHLGIGEGAEDSWSDGAPTASGAAGESSVSESRPLSLHDPVRWATPDGRLMTWDEGCRALAEAALRLTRGNVTRAAALLGIKRTTLHHRMKALGIENGGRSPSGAGRSS